jgi:hypothetical protein
MGAFAGLPAHVPLPWQTSGVVHKLPSSHTLPGWGTAAQLPLAESQRSLVHGFLSSQILALPVHLPLPHVSGEVQGLPSSQLLPLAGVYLQPSLGSQISLVQGLASSQLTLAAGTQLPLMQPSPVVQTLPSSQLPLLGVLVHLPATHASAVQGLASSQGVPLPLHAPALQISPVVQASPSLHGAPFCGAVTQPTLGSQLSEVQGLLSLHTSLAPPVHTAPVDPTVHASPLVQALPSSQGWPIAGELRQPAVRSQVSKVQGLPSSHALA